VGNGKASALKSAALGDCWETGALAKATSIDVAVSAQSKGRLIRCTGLGPTQSWARLAVGV